MSVGAAQKAKSSAQAAYMKEHGVRRRTGRCPLCYSVVGIPMDRHFTGGACAPRRKSIL